MKIAPEKRGNATISRFPYEYQKGETIPVIASFSDNGKVLPLYLRINEESYKVIECHEVDNNRSVAEFRCFIEDCGIRKEVRVKYFYAEAIWFIAS